MGIQEKISAELLESMKARDAVRTSTLRLLVSAFRNKEIERQKTLSDGELLEVIQSEAKRRQESIEQFRQAQRSDLASKEEAELKVLQAYLPQALSESELQALVAEAITSVQATSAKDMGKVMSALMPKIRGRADGKQAQQLVQKSLS